MPQDREWIFCKIFQAILIRLCFVLWMYIFAVEEYILKFTGYLNHCLLQSHTISYYTEYNRIGIWDIYIFQDKEASLDINDDDDDPSPKDDDDNK